jgi:hypothetical protein
VICDNTVAIRRIAFVPKPDYLFIGQAMKIMRYDDDITKDFHANIRTNVSTPYIDDKKNWGTANWKKK